MRKNSRLKDANPKLQNLKYQQTCCCFTNSYEGLYFWTTIQLQLEAIKWSITLFFYKFLRQHKAAMNLQKLGTTQQVDYPYSLLGS